jgi:hypothetical protein
MSSNKTKKSTTTQPACVVCARPAAFACASCAAAFYCGAAHQQTHWTDGGHAAECGGKRSGRWSSTTTTSSGTTTTTTTTTIGVRTPIYPFGPGEEGHPDPAKRAAARQRLYNRFVEKFGRDKAERYARWFPRASWHERYFEAYHDALMRMHDRKLREEYTKLYGPEWLRAIKKRLKLEDITSLQFLLRRSYEHRHLAREAEEQQRTYDETYWKPLFAARFGQARAAEYTTSMPGRSWLQRFEQAVADKVPAVNAM